MDVHWTSNRAKPFTLKGRTSPPKRPSLQGGGGGRLHLEKERLARAAFFAKKCKNIWSFEKNNVPLQRF